MSEQKSSVWKWVGIGCGGIVLLMLCIFGSCALMGGGIWAAVELPAEQAKGFFSDVRAHHYSAAYARTSSSFRATHDEAAFQAAVEAQPALASHTDDTISSRNVNGNRATMSGTLTTPQGSVPITIELSDSGGWKIDSILIDGSPL